jgi:hypothetical protein
MNASDPLPFVLDPKIQAILDAPLPACRGVALRREERKVIAAAVRKLFREMGLKGMSVTAPNYSMAQAIDIKTPRNDPEPLVYDDEEFMYGKHHPAYREARNAVLAKVEAIVLAAYPDLDNRSDYHSDHYDYRLSIS